MTEQYAPKKNNTTEQYAPLQYRSELFFCSPSVFGIVHLCGKGKKDDTLEGKPGYVQVIPPHMQSVPNPLWPYHPCHTLSSHPYHPLPAGQKSLTVGKGRLSGGNTLIHPAGDRNDNSFQFSYRKKGLLTWNLFWSLLSLTRFSLRSYIFYGTQRSTFGTKRKGRPFLLPAEKCDLFPKSW